MSAGNKEIMQRFFDELFNRGDLSVADELVASDYVNHNPVPGETPGREGLKAFVAYLRATFPDLHITIEDLISAEDKVVTRMSITGTQQGEFAGVPATGKTVQVGGINIHRLRDGQIQEAWLNWDALGMMQQLGVIPTPD
jgi:steroid delta-isomerase-like uncharacterized protein